jgi:cytochrome c5
MVYRNRQTQLESIRLHAQRNRTHKGRSDLTKEYSMLKRLIAIVLTISIAAPAIAVQAKDVLVLKTVNVILPTSDRMFPDGPGSDVVNSYCLVCHSAGMVLSQPAMTRSAWEAEVQKMRNAYKAPIPEGQIQTIVSYLASLQNAK